MGVEMDSFKMGFDVREVRDWGTAVVKFCEQVPAGVRPGYWTSKGTWVKSAHFAAYSVRECQDWQKTCRAFARIYGFCVAVYCDDTVVTFALTHSGRVKQSKRTTAKIDWCIAA